MTPDSPATSHTPRGRRFSFWLKAALATLFVVSLLLSARYYYYTQGPGFVDHPDMVRANQLMKVAQRRPLTDDEFQNTLALLNSPVGPAVMVSVAIVNLEVPRDPSRSEAALIALRNSVPDADEPVKSSLLRAIQRLEAPPPGP